MRFVIPAWLGGARMNHRNGHASASENGASTAAAPATKDAASDVQKILAGGGADYFDALRQSPNRTPLTLGGPSRGMLGGWDRIQLSLISRALYDNGGFVGYAVEQIARYCAPVIPQANSDNPAWNAAAEDYWTNWCLSCDWYGRSEFDLPALQKYISQSTDIDGDVGVILQSGPDGPKVQVVEGYRIVSPSENKPNVIDGVQLDASARVQGYHVAQYDPKNEPFGYQTSNKTEHFNPNQMTLVREVRATETYRGMSALRRGANHIRDGNDLIAFAKLAWKNHCSIKGAVEGGYLDDEHGFDLTGDETKPGPDATPGAKSLGRWDMLGGDFPVLPPGKTLKPVNFSAPSDGLDSVLDSLLGIFSAGLGIPPAFFLDSKLTGPNARSVNGKAQRRFMERRAMLARLIRWLWIRVIGDAMATGKLANQAGFERITFNFPPDISIDSGDDSESDRKDLEVSNQTRQRIWGRRGQDWKTGVDQIAAEDDYIIDTCKKQSTRTGVPLDNLLIKWGMGPPKLMAAPVASVTPQGKPSG